MTPAKLSSTDPDVAGEAISRVVAERTSSLDQPPFEYRVLWATDYDALLADSFEASSEPTALLEAARSHGRVIVHAPAGSGKTRVLLNIFSHAATRALPFYIDLRRWRPELFDRWDFHAGSKVQQMGLLLEELAEPPIDEATLSAIESDVERYLLVDGLNEVPPRYANAILTALDALAQREPRLGFVVADRLTRRPVDSSKWALAAIAPLALDVVEAHLGSTHPVRPDFLQRPFFLNMAIQRGLDSASEADTFSQFFKLVGLDGPSLDACASAAYHAYKSNRSRSFLAEEFSSFAADAPLAKLTQGGVVVKASDGRLYFAHHLFHDYLAARYLSSHPEDWGYEAFDIVTFEAASFDALSLALEQIDDSPSADTFVRLVYDWNPYAPAYVLAKSASQEESQVSADMYFVIGAMLAERRWDPIKASAQRSEDALLLLAGVIGRAFLDVRSFEELQRLVRGHQMEQVQFKEWRSVFLATSSIEPELLVRELREADSLIGWTAANVLRRVSLSQEMLGVLREDASSSSAVVRWRAVHALGAHPSLDTVDALTSRLLDELYWVRYGAIRAMIECARDPDVRSVVLERLIANLSAIIEGRLESQLAACLDLRAKPAGWLDFAEPLIEELWLEADSVELQDRWRQLAYVLGENAEATS